MFDIIKQRIMNRGYKLTEMQHVINRRHDMGGLTDEQEEELLALALKYAEADSERPELLAMLTALSARMDELEALLKGQQGNGPDDGNSGDGEGAGTEEMPYPAWKPWDGISKDYQQGDIVTHAGTVWESAFAGQNVWEPGAPGTEKLWVEVVVPE